MSKTTDKPSFEDFSWLTSQILAGNASASVHRADGTTWTMNADFQITIQARVLTGAR